MGLIERWRMSRPEWQAFHQEAMIGARDQADRNLARANAAMAERDEAREQLRGAVDRAEKAEALLREAVAITKERESSEQLRPAPLGALPQGSWSMIANRVTTLETVEWPSSGTRYRLREPLKCEAGDSIMVEVSGSHGVVTVRREGQVVGESLADLQ